jgi:hypothetical protein
MATKSLKPYGAITRSQILEAIKRLVTLGITPVVRGHNGWGKTAMEKDLQLAYPNHRLVRMDMTTKEAGDILMPKFKVIDGNDVVSGVPHEELGLHLGGDVILFIDEIFKAKKPLQVALAQLLYEHKLGTHQLSKNSFVVGASNLEDEGFGDQSLGFVYNRISVLELAKPTNESWINDFALPRGLHPTAIASAKEYPAMFADYRQYSKPGDNQYIFDPRAPQAFYVTGRSLERASNILKSLDGMEAEVVTHALANCVGDRAAMDMMAVHELYDKMPRWEEIIKNPTKAKVPESAGACCLLVYTAIQNLDAKNAADWMTYCLRLKKEVQALFASSVLRVSEKAKVISTHKDFLKWGLENQHLYAAQV